MKRNDDEARREAAVWKEIVENYGDEPSQGPDDSGREDDSSSRRLLGDEPDPLSRFDAADDYLDREEPFTAPEPGLPPIKNRLSAAAWVVVVLAPLALLVLLIVFPGMSTLIVYLLIAAFLAAICYLFTRLPKNRDPDEGPGSRL